MRKKHLFTIVLSLFLLAVVFQNCGSKVGFAMDNSKLVSLGGEDVICDPFSAGSTCTSGSGLKGSSYYLSSDDTTSPRGKVDDIIQYGLKVPWQVVFSKFDVDAREWTEGFPSNDGLMKNADGQPLVEWFAFHLEGSISIKPGDETEYEFATFSDDGSIVWVNGVEVVSHDGQHSPSWKCGGQKVTLSAGQSHSMRLKYFQGPRNRIALRLLWRPWSDSAKPCGEGFTPVPSSVLFHAVQ